MHSEWLYSFIESAKLGSFSKASEKRNLTQPALSKHIRSLEEYLQVSLFSRTPQGVSLTEAGEYAYPIIENIVNQLNKLICDVNHFGEIPKLTIGALPSLALHYLPQKILDHTGSESYKIVVINHSSLLLKQVRNGGIDAALCEVKETNLDRDLFIRPLYYESFYVVVPLGHAISKKSEVIFDDIKNESWVVHPTGCDIRLFLEKLFRKYHKELSVEIECEFGESILGFVAAGAGITILPSAEANLRSFTSLVAIPIKEIEAQRQLYVVSRFGKVDDKVRLLFQLD